jgi:hypothetical protein
VISDRERGGKDAHEGAGSREEMAATHSWIGQFLAVPHHDGRLAHTGKGSPTMADLIGKDDARASWSILGFGAGGW